jgi:hypothetical protein
MISVNSISITHSRRKAEDGNYGGLSLTLSLFLCLSLSPISFPTERRGKGKKKENIKDFTSFSRDVKHRLSHDVNIFIIQ